ncbi:uncharacterized protein MONOS_17881 [Monocercomonoides exilis]|uniref:uncharacterized protein n=1 Tax=Monocercomonoides exilis TaxID=2049356 RepID=UPI0035597BFB|nr:hypothetical protein MONOS_17881 [Monocercomonoides exilis]
MSITCRTRNIISCVTTDNGGDAIFLEFCLMTFVNWMAKGNTPISSITQKDIISGIQLIVEMANLRFVEQHDENGADCYIAIGK